MYYMGVDGGGTSLRVVIVDDHLNIIAQTRGDSVNPGKIGYALAAARVKEAIAAVLHEAPVEIAACALGIAGASVNHSAEWVSNIGSTALPYSLIIPSSDLEIALVGAHGERCGLLLLSGTGSAAFGIDRDGNSALVGGWGYLVDDLGSGYWIGNQTFQYAVQSLDGRRLPDALSQRVLQQIGCTNRAEITRWLYHDDENVVSRIAGLAEIVLLGANDQLPVALSILDAATAQLERMVVSLRQQLIEGESLPVRFGGGLLQEENPLSRLVCIRLNLPDFPKTLYPPAVGAALLAKLQFNQS
jgi:N-acetylglucosamine kinase-like BadF-type ATPase